MSQCLYLVAMEAWENQFSCDCGNCDPSNFAYIATYANGEEWRCKNCGKESMFSDQPNEDIY